MKEFKTQFLPALIIAGSSRKSKFYGRKHYVAAFVQSRALVHESKVQHKTATAAIQYAKAVLARYQRMAQAALLAFVETQNELAEVLNVGAVKDSEKAV